jgi:hypothetical protein
MLSDIDKMPDVVLTPDRLGMGNRAWAEKAFGRGRDQSQIIFLLRRQAPGRSPWMSIGVATRAVPLEERPAKPRKASTSIPATAHCSIRRELDLRLRGRLSPENPVVHLIAITFTVPAWQGATLAQSRRAALHLRGRPAPQRGPTGLDQRATTSRTFRSSTIRSPSSTGGIIAQGAEARARWGDSHGVSRCAAFDHGGAIRRAPRIDVTINGPRGRRTDDLEPRFMGRSTHTAGNRSFGRGAASRSFRMRSGFTRSKPA